MLPSKSTKWPSGQSVRWISCLETKFPVEEQQLEDRERLLLELDGNTLAAQFPPVQVKFEHTETEDLTRIARVHGLRPYGFRGAVSRPISSPGRNYFRFRIQRWLAGVNSTPPFLAGAAPTLS
jgi:hypothetical protein